MAWRDSPTDGQINTRVFFRNCPSGSASLSCDLDTLENTLEAISLDACVPEYNSKDRQITCRSNSSIRQQDCTAFYPSRLPEEEDYAFVVVRLS